MAEILQPRALIVIPTLNEAAHIEQVTERLLNEGANTRATLVVVDGGSHDGTQELVARLSAKYRNVHLLHNPHRIQSAAINLAASRFGQDADVLIRCDAHADYPPNYVRRLLETMIAQRADAVVVPLDSRGERTLQRAIAWLSNSPIGTGGAAHRAGKKSGFVDHGHHAAFRMETFRQLGGYDETFSHNEDAEFDCRQRALGAKIYLDADVRVCYYPRATWLALFRQYYRYGMGRSRTARRHPSSIRLRQLVVPAHLLVCLVAFCLSPWFPSLLWWPLLYALTLSAASLWCAIQGRTISGCLAAPAAVVMHVAWAAGFISGLLRFRESTWDSRRTAPLRFVPISRGRS